MRKLPAVFLAIACTIIALACHRNEHDINLTFTDSEHYYFMKAYFGKNKTRNVEHYLDNRIGRRSNMSFVNSQIDGMLTLDDHTTFYIKKSAGLLTIKFDKDQNSAEAYNRMRSMCEGIKMVLTK